MCQYAPVPANMLPHCTLSAMDKSFLRRRDCFGRRWFLQVCLLKLSHGNKMKQAYVDISVFGGLRKQRPRFTGDKPKCCFHMKELERTTKAIARVNAGWRKLSALSSICQHVATCGNIAVFRCAEKDKAGQDPCFRRRWLFQICLHREMNIIMNASADFLFSFVPTNYSFAS